MSSPHRETKTIRIFVCKYRSITPHWSNLCWRRHYQNYLVSEGISSSSLVLISAFHGPGSVIKQWSAVITGLILFYFFPCIIIFCSGSDSKKYLFFFLHRPRALSFAPPSPSCPRAPYSDFGSPSRTCNLSPCVGRRLRGQWGRRRWCWSLRSWSWSTRRPQICRASSRPLGTRGVPVSPSCWRPLSQTCMVGAYRATKRGLAGFFATITPESRNALPSNGFRFTCMAMCHKLSAIYHSHHLTWYLRVWLVLHHYYVMGD